MANTIDKVDKIGNSFRWFELNAVRILLGAFILYKGVMFLSQTELLLDILRPIDNGFTEFLLVHYIALGHIAGGILIAFGILLRLACVVQIPILIGAVIANTYSFNISELLISSLVLVSLLFFMIKGSEKKEEGSL